MQGRLEPAGGGCGKGDPGGRRVNCPAMVSAASRDGPLVGR